MLITHINSYKNSLLFHPPTSIQLKFNHFLSFSHRIRIVVWYCSELDFMPMYQTIKVDYLVVFMLLKEHFPQERAERSNSSSSSKLQRVNHFITRHTTCTFWENYYKLALGPMLEMVNTIIIVALGSFGISISFPTGPVIFTSAPGFKSPEMEEI